MTAAKIPKRTKLVASIDDRQRTWRGIARSAHDASKVVAKGGAEGKAAWAAMLKAHEILIRAGRPE